MKIYGKNAEDKSKQKEKEKQLKVLISIHLMFDGILRPYGWTVSLRFILKTKPQNCESNNSTMRIRGKRRRRREKRTLSTVMIIMTLFNILSFALYNGLEISGEINFLKTKTTLQWKND